MCFYKYQPVNEEPNYKQVGHLKVAFVEEPGNNAEALIVCSNTKLISGQETLQHNLQVDAGKASYLKEHPVVKPGQVITIAIASHTTIRMVLYVVLADTNAALKDFFLHKGLVRALELALKEEKCARVSILSPKYNLLGISEDYYVEKLSDSLRVMGHKMLPGVVSTQVRQKFHKQMEEQLSKKHYEDGDCQQW